MGEEGGERVVIEALGASLSDAPLEVGPERAVAAAGDGRRDVGCDESAEAWSADDQPVVLEIAICAKDGVWVESDPSHNLFDRGQLIAWLQQSKQESLADLLD
jgi:hypothetical protein